MSSSYVIEPQESSSEKKDDTLIIVVNDDGIISVDQATLQNLISKWLLASWSSKIYIFWKIGINECLTCNNKKY